MNDDSIMPFGKFRGQTLVNIPADHLLKLLDDNKCSGALKSYIEDNKYVLEFQVSYDKKKVGFQERTSRRRYR